MHTQRLRFCFVVIIHLLAVAPNCLAIYNPELGRWLSRDPVEEQGGMNLYGMVANDPVNQWDYLGLELRTLVFVSGPDGTGLAIPSASGIAPASKEMEQLAQLLEKNLGWRPRNATLMNGQAVGTRDELNKYANEVRAEGKCVHDVELKYKYAPTANEAKTFLNQAAHRHIVLAHGDVDKNGQTGVVFQVPGATWRGGNVAAAYPVSSVIPANTGNFPDKKLGIGCCQPGGLPKTVGDVEIKSLAGSTSGPTFEGIFWNYFKDAYRCLCGATK